MCEVGDGWGEEGEGGGGVTWHVREFKRLFLFLLLSFFSSFSTSIFILSFFRARMLLSMVKISQGKPENPTSLS